jgi:hypothetical protein
MYMFWLFILTRRIFREVLFPQKQGTIVQGTERKEAMMQRTANQGSIVQGLKMP